MTTNRTRRPCAILPRCSGRGAPSKRGRGPRPTWRPPSSTCGAPATRGRPSGWCWAPRGRRPGSGTADKHRGFSPLAHLGGLRAPRGLRPRLRRPLARRRERRLLQRLPECAIGPLPRRTPHRLPASAVGQLLRRALWVRRSRRRLVYLTTEHPGRSSPGSISPHPGRYPRTPGPSDTDRSYGRWSYHCRGIEVKSPAPRPSLPPAPPRSRRGGVDARSWRSSPAPA